MTLAKTEMASMTETVESGLRDAGCAGEEQKHETSLGEGLLL